ncbi:MAG TPA: ACP S-malonyltransferase [Methylomusa anaerophila]|uniref:[acyl-carrier-protein] S-malonyltransferase n=1 Tax=Methylomusa anaerophila TaxID=1930071 RepID=A0A348AQS7_9FIRM|nr:ACP S-malonyltransferase [Methylomusa anaerophila]BBB93425.1 polyketide biosynthesis protein BaeE [Methylomusa anaerophila]HML90050.1 ACP S-malonyltransferase [Methylomusa anaerophila]
MLSYLFPGQGSQVKGMGKDLFKKYEDLVKTADQILGYSIEELCVHDSKNLLGQTQYTQPALYTVNCLMYLNKIHENNLKPDFLAGHSLGEYCALFASEVFDFETGLKLVKKRGEIMSKAKEGGMAAVIGIDAEKVNEIIKQNQLENNIDIANLNSPYQIVISGAKKAIENAKTIFEASGAQMYIPLKVSGAFHSRMMTDARDEFAGFINDFKFSEPMIPVISNVTARPYEKTEIKNLLTEQITHSVKWTETIRYLMGKENFESEEVGPGNVLTKLVEKIISEAEPLYIEEEKKAEIATNADGNSAENNVQSFLGSDEFKKRYNLKFAYVTGAMYKGVASAPLVIEAAKNGMLSFFGTGGLSLNEVEKSIENIQANVNGITSYGMNFLHNPDNPSMEEKLVDLYLKYQIPNIEIAAFMNITPALARLRIKTLEKKGDSVVSKIKLIAKISRPEIAEACLRPVPEKIIQKLINEKQITQQEADLAKKYPIADDICAEADSGGHTDGAVAFALLPAIQKVRDDIVKEYEYKEKIHIGLAGGIGTPQAAAAAFMMGADFILTGSINQCTIEAGTSDEVKTILQDIDVHNTEYAPAGDMFEMGAKVQVAKKGILFPARANRLYELYRQYNSLEEIDAKTIKQLEEKYFGRTLQEIYEDCKRYWNEVDPWEIEKAEKNPKCKMAMIFKWYFGYSTRAALNGDIKEKVNFQIHCGPALGSFNQWVKGTQLESWKNRNVAKIGEKIMNSAAELFWEKLKTIKI